MHSEAAGKPSEERFILTQWGAVPSTVAMYNYLQPITASLIAVAASQETFGPVKALAMLLVFLGVWFVSTSEQRKTGIAIFSLRKDRN